MTEKRLIVDDDYAWVDTVTECVIEVEDAFDLVNELWEQNDYLLKVMFAIKEYAKNEDYENIIKAINKVSERIE